MVNYNKTIKLTIPMTERLIYYIIALTLFSFGCRTIKERDFVVLEPSLGTTFSNIQGSIDLNNLKQKISYGDVALTGYYNGVVKIKQDVDSQKLVLVDRNLFLSEQKVTSDFDSLRVVIEDDNFNVRDYKMNPERYYTRAEFIPEERVNDFIKLFAKEIKSSIIKTDSGMYGNIHFELLSFKERKNALLACFSLWTLCQLTLIGVPLTCINTSLEVKLTIYNRRNQLIGSYKAEGKGTGWVAMYWGYGNDAWRKSALLALRNAIILVKAEINNDKDKIITELRK